MTFTFFLLKTSTNHCTFQFLTHTKLKEAFKLENQSKESFSAVEGVGNISSLEGGVIIKGEIGIDKNINQNKIAILEELVQILGLPADSHSYRESIFYQPRKQIEELNKIDKKIIQLLYHPNIPVGLSRLSFEETFAKVLHPVNANQKILNYLIQETVEIDILELIKNTCFINNKLYKFPKDIPVYSIGDYKQNDIEFLKKGISEIDNLSDKFNIYYGNNKSYVTQDGIFVEYQSTDLPKDSLFRKIGVQLGKGMYTKRFISTIDLKYNKTIDRKKYPKIISALFDCIGPLYAKESLFEDGIRFKEKYGKMIDLIYNQVFPDGYDLNDFEEVIEEYKKYIYEIN